jgi:hypothetical protein
LTLTLNDGTLPRATWSVDDTRVGSVGADGVFHANGLVGGLVVVTGTVGSGVVSTTITVNVDITDGAAAVPAASQTVLRTGGAGGDALFRWLYPYTGTVFPRGLAAPLLQFDAASANATYLKITAPHFSYQQFAVAALPLRVTIPPAIWTGVTRTAGPRDAVNVAVTKLTGTVATGPVTQSWNIAGGSMTGIVYYNTYKSLKAPFGGIMRVPAGQDATPLIAAAAGSTCGTVCHSVNPNGSVLSASTGNALILGDQNPTNSLTFNLTAAGTAVARTPAGVRDGRLFSFSALTPDGRVAFVDGLPPLRWPPFIPHGIFSTLGYPSKLVDTATGLDIPAPTLPPLVRYATMPSFSPDGTQVAFINGDRLAPTCIDEGCVGTCLDTCPRVLTVLDYNPAVNPPAFSNLRDVVTQAGAGKAVAWPTFLPDGAGIIYHEGDLPDSFYFRLGGASLPAFAELRLVEAATRTIKTLNAVNGRTAAGVSYLPFGETVEGRMNYEASMLPVAVGGYYWVLFTSRRVYGNTINPTNTPVGATPGVDAFGTDSAPSSRKKIWMAAIDIDHVNAADPSHPAFYLPGQEVESGNMRAFAALAPCRPNQSACESGADCCGGFCRETSRTADGLPILQCVPPPVNMCSLSGELCTTRLDCCDPGNMCINGRCAILIP